MALYKSIYLLTYLLTYITPGSEPSLSGDSEPGVMSGGFTSANPEI